MPKQRTTTPTTPTKVRWLVGVVLFAEFCAVLAIASLQFAC